MRVQWFRAEAEMYRWLELYERKHAEFLRIIERYRRDSEVWMGLADRAEQQGAATFARMLRHASCDVSAVGAQCQGHFQEC